jgi:hypothetical protein
MVHVAPAGIELSCVLSLTFPPHPPLLLLELAFAGVPRAALAQQPARGSGLSACRRNKST